MAVLDVSNAGLRAALKFSFKLGYRRSGEALNTSKISDGQCGEPMPLAIFETSEATTDLAASALTSGLPRQAVLSKSSNLWKRAMVRATWFQLPEVQSGALVARSDSGRFRSFIVAIGSGLHMLP